MENLNKWVIEHLVKQLEAGTLRKKMKFELAEKVEGWTDLTVGQRTTVGKLFRRAVSSGDIPWLRDAGKDDGSNHRVYVVV